MTEESKLSSLQTNMKIGDPDLDEMGRFALVSGFNTVIKLKKNEVFTVASPAINDALVGEWMNSSLELYLTGLKYKKYYDALEEPYPQELIRFFELLATPFPAF
jgi:hypothetical protein